MKKKARWSMVAVAILAAMAAAWFWAAPAYVLSRAEETARAKGMEARIGSVSVSWRKVEARDVRITSKYFPRQTAFLKRLVVKTDSLMKITEVSVDGASIRLSGTVKDLEDMTSRWKEEKSGGGAGVKGGAGVRKTMKDVSVHWSRLAGDDSSMEAEEAYVQDGHIGSKSTKVRIKKSWVEAEDVEVKIREQKLLAKRVRASIQKPTIDIPTRKTTVTSGSGTSESKSLSLEIGESDIKLGGTRFVIKETIANATVADGTVRLTTTVKSVNLNSGTSSEDVVAKIAVKKFGDGVKLSGTVSAGMLTAENEKVADGKIKARRVEIRGKAYLSSESATAQGTIDVGEARVAVTGKWEKNTSVSVDAEMEESNCQKLLESIPQSVVPDLMPGTKMAGSLSWRMQADVDLPDRKNPSVRIKLKNKCRITEVPPSVDVKRFRKPFSMEVYGPDKKRVSKKTGPGTSDWVPLTLVSRFVPLAFKTTEDPGFFAHNGFHIEAMENSMKMNITAGKFIRGASTISMQLAKNLWLSRDKTLSRKIQEAILTTYLEQELSKEQILELYLNVVEFGPGLYGIGPASKYYFGSHPMQLSMSQSLYLSSILPNPLKSGFVHGGQVHPAKMSWLHRVMKAMRDRQLISEDEYKEAVREVLTFGSRSTGAEEPGPVETSTDGLDPGEWDGLD